MARGTKWPKGAGWFKDGALPMARDGPFYEMMRFFSIVQLSTFVVPAIIEPHSQYLTYFSCILMFLNLIHQIIAFSGLVKVYKEVLPDTKEGKMQIGFGMVMGISVLVVNVLACLHEGSVVPYVASYYSGQPHILPIFATNIILCAFGTINALQLIIAPTHFMSTWFGTPKEDLPADYTPKKFMGFDVMPENGCMTFMARNMGIYFLSLALVMAVHPIDGVSSMFYHPLWTLGAFLFFCTQALHSIHGLQLQDADDGADAGAQDVRRQTWIPQIVVAAAQSSACASSFLSLHFFVRLAPVDADFDGETAHAGHHALYDAAAMLQDAVDPNLAILVVNVLASLHDQCTTVVGVPFVESYYTGYPHVFPLLPVNIILCDAGAI